MKINYVIIAMVIVVAMIQWATYSDMRRMWLCDHGDMNVCSQLLPQG